MAAKAAPSGCVQWSRGGYQGPIGWVVHEGRDAAD
jgi:hypothetical protein